MLLNNEFAEFVFRNRNNYKYHIFTKCVHSYDFIGGPMSDGKQIDDFTDYALKRITKGEFLERLMRPKENWQLLIHNQKLCNALTITGIYNLKGERVDEII